MYRLAQMQQKQGSKAMLPLFGWKKMRGYYLCRADNYQMLRVFVIHSAGSYETLNLTELLQKAHVKTDYKGLFFNINKPQKKKLIELVKQSGKQDLGYVTTGKDGVLNLFGRREAY